MRADAAGTEFYQHLAGAEDIIRRGGLEATASSPFYMGGVVRDNAFCHVHIRRVFIRPLALWRGTGGRGYAHEPDDL